VWTSLPVDWGSGEGKSRQPERQLERETTENVADFFLH